MDRSLWRKATPPKVADPLPPLARPRPRGASDKVVIEVQNCGPSKTGSVRLIPGEINRYTQDSPAIENMNVIDLDQHFRSDCKYNFDFKKSQGLSAMSDPARKGL